MIKVKVIPVGDKGSEVPYFLGPFSTRKEAIWAEENELAAADALWQGGRSLFKTEFVEERLSH